MIVPVILARPACLKSLFKPVGLLESGVGGWASGGVKANV
jgi:hypothetical protein